MPQLMGGFECKDIVTYQNLYGHPFHLLALRTVINNGEVSYVPKGAPYVIFRSNDTHHGFPFPIPYVTFETTEIFRKVYQDSTSVQLQEYQGGSGRNPISPDTQKKIEEKIERMLQAPSPRLLLYAIQTPSTYRHLGDFSAYLHLHDGSAIKGIPDEFHPLEILSGWEIPERQNKDPIGLIEITTGYKNPDQMLADLNAFPFLLKEVGTYVDIHYQMRGIPSVVRLITEGKARRRVFQSQYHFQDDPSAHHLQEKNLYVMQMGGEEFIHRFGSEGAQYQTAFSKPFYDGNRILWPFSPLHDPVEYQAAVQSREQRLHKLFQQFLESCARNPEARVMGFDVPVRIKTYLEYLRSIGYLYPELLF